MSCSTYQLPGGLASPWCDPAPPETSSEDGLEERALRSSIRALTVFETERELSDLRISRAGSNLESFGTLLVQIVFIFGVVELVMRHTVVPTRVLVALLIVGVTYWLTIRELRRKARASIGP
jgi:hypothetical protein